MGCSRLRDESLGGEVATHSSGVSVEVLVHVAFVSAESVVEVGVGDARVGEAREGGVVGLQGVLVPAVHDGSQFLLAGGWNSLRYSFLIVHGEAICQIRE